MKHFASPDFWKSFNCLSLEIQKLAKKNFELIKLDPRHPSIRLKKAGVFWSARVGIQYRALAKERSEGLVHCFRKGGSSIRLISARRAGTKEQQPYWEKKNEKRV